jgi:hypothetical protein
VASKRVTSSTRMRDQTCEGIEPQERRRATNEGRPASHDQAAHGRGRVRNATRRRRDMANDLPTVGRTPLRRACVDRIVRERVRHRIGQRAAGPRQIGSPGRTRTNGHQTYGDKRAKGRLAVVTPGKEVKPHRGSHLPIERTMDSTGTPGPHARHTGALRWVRWSEKPQGRSLAGRSAQRGPAEDPTSKRDRPEAGRPGQRERGQRALKGTKTSREAPDSVRRAVPPGTAVPAGGKMKSGRS